MDFKYYHFLFYFVMQLVVADVTHDPSETPVVLETPVVDDDYSHVKKKPCSDIFTNLHKNSFLPHFCVIKM